MFSHTKLAPAVRQSWLTLFGFLPVALCTSAAWADSTIELTVVDEETGEPIASRVYLTNAGGEAYFFEVPAQPGAAVRYDKQNWINARSVERHTTVTQYPCQATVPPGKYTVVCERGKTYHAATRTVTVAAADVALVIPLRRWADPASRGWYSGDTHIHRPVDEMRNVVLAEDLNVAFPLSYWVTRSDTPPTAGERNVDVDLPAELIEVDARHVIWPRNTEYEIFTTAGRDHTLGALFVLGHREPLEMTVPPWRPLLKSVRESDRDVMFDMDKLDWPFAMLLPTLVPDALYELANNHLWRTEFAFRQWSTPAPPFMQPPFGASEGGERAWIDYTLGMYYTLLDAGFRMPPSAGTANGVHPVPAGFGRVYVHLPEGFSFDAWRRGLSQGRSFVTTGPMLSATADRQDPGHVFQFPSEPDGRPEIPVRIEVLSETPLTFGEILVNGQPEELLRPANEPTEGGAYRSVFATTVVPKRSGWMAVRVFEDREGGRTRFAHTAPWYIEIGDQPVRIPAAEKQYLIERVRAEIQRSQKVVPPAAMREYEAALRHYEQLPVLDDSQQVARSARPLGEGEDRQRWLENMVVHHRLTADELRMATGMSRDEAVATIDALASRQTEPADEEVAHDVLKVLPYPGGRHPRRGFLEGARDPQRETKISIFAPWSDGGYIVVDAPEAIFSNLGLTYLAHTHIPTIWDQQSKVLPPLEWQQSGDGWVMERRLPNGIVFRTTVTPRRDSVDMEMELTNGTSDPLTGLRCQVCVMLAGAPGFNHQSLLPHVIEDSFVAIRGEQTNRWIITSWQPLHRAWTNPPVPCIHSDPIFPDCAPGETVRVKGHLWFYEGDQLPRHIDHLRDAAD